MTESAPPLRTCIKCGSQIAEDVAICSVCNRAGMATPSTTQYHATVVAAVVLAVAALAIVASLSMRGVGPYDGQVVGFSAEAEGLAVTLSVRNEGTREGRAQCQLTAVASNGARLGAVTLLSPRIGGGETLTFGERMPELVTDAERVVISCR